MNFPTLSIGPVNFRFKGFGRYFFFIFIQILQQNSVSRQWRPRSDAALCSVGSKFALFAYVPQKGRYAYMD